MHWWPLREFMFSKTEIYISRKEDETTCLSCYDLDSTEKANHSHPQKDIMREMLACAKAIELHLRSVAAFLNIIFIPSCTVQSV
jgi:hypothetical protein